MRTDVLFKYSISVIGAQGVAGCSKKHLILGALRHGLARSAAHALNAEALGYVPSYPMSVIYAQAGIHSSLALEFPCLRRPGSG